MQEGTRVYIDRPLTERDLFLSDEIKMVVPVDAEGVIEFVSTLQPGRCLVEFERDWGGTNMYSVPMDALKPVFGVGNKVWAAQNITFHDLIGDPREHNIFVEKGTPGVVTEIRSTGEILVLFENEEESRAVTRFIQRTKPLDLSRVSHVFDREFEDGYLHIYDRDGSEIVALSYDDFSDPLAIHAAIATVDLFYREGPEVLKKALGKS